MNKSDSEKLVLDEQNRRRTANQPISRDVTSESETAKKKELPANENQPNKTQIESEREAIRKSERTDCGEKVVLCKQEKQLIQDMIGSTTVQSIRFRYVR